MFKADVDQERQILNSKCDPAEDAADRDAVSRVDQHCQHSGHAVRTFRRTLADMSNLFADPLPKSK